MKFRICELSPIITELLLIWRKTPNKLTNKQTNEIETNIRRAERAESADQYQTARMSRLILTYTLRKISEWSLRAGFRLNRYFLLVLFGIKKI